MALVVHSLKRRLSWVLVRNSEYAMLLRILLIQYKGILDIKPSFILNRVNVTLVPSNGRIRRKIRHNLELQRERCVCIVTSNSRAIENHNKNKQVHVPD